MSSTYFVYIGLLPELRGHGGLELSEGPWLPLGEPRVTAMAAHALRCLPFDGCTVLRLLSSTFVPHLCRVSF